MSATARPHSQPTQADRILAHLQAGYRLTPGDARRTFGCDRLGARIFELKRRGHVIQSHLIKVASGKRVAEYFLPTT